MADIGWGHMSSFSRPQIFWLIVKSVVHAADMSPGQCGHVTTRLPRSGDVLSIRKKEMGSAAGSLAGLGYPALKKSWKSKFAIKAEDFKRGCLIIPLLY